MPTTPVAVRRYTGSAKVRDRGLQHKESWERVYWESLGRSQRENSQLGYRVDEAPKAEISEDDDGGLCHTSPADTSQENKKSPPKRLKAGRRADPDSLWKHLWHSRKLVLAVKQGCSYFHLLQEQEVQEEQQREKRRREERRKRAIRPPSVSSDSDTDREAERGCVTAGVSTIWKRSRRRRVQSARPFTPVHQSLTSHQPQQLAQEHMYRQLCCLCWLLESLTLEHSGRVGPVVSCWDAKDPGRSRNTLKTLNKEKAIQAKWEQFVSPPKSLRPVLKVSRVCSARSLTRKSSSLSMPSSVAMTSSLGSSLSSLVLDAKDPSDVTVPTEDGECQSAEVSEADPPVNEYLRKLLEEVHKSVAKELHGSEMQYGFETDWSEALRSVSSRLDSAVTGNVDTPRPKSSASRRPATTAFSHRKAVMLDEIRLAFEDRAEELALSLTDTLDRSAKKRWSSGVQRYRILSNVSTYRSLTSSLCSVTFTLGEQQSENTDVPDRPYSTQWLAALLGSLPPHTHLDRKLVCVLEKLKRFTAERSLRIRPHVFLRVLNSLQPWELCCPDLCVAIEIVRQNAVRMSVEEYDCWLRGRINLPQTTLSIKP
ncbi:coiled-coil domain-containing protein 60-like isoform X2 [Colossoma macropomum]|uniref:coiled-coil domain-containing protein 60-like isoform X2 n=1 Tax=Colossoma macropomum TaxID=42526 RepID=UPI00186553E5|nr:coiled-coil domain-containing protein 60-like isoform X2 [Colossoma macropomum]